MEGNHQKEKWTELTGKKNRYQTNPITTEYFENVSQKIAVWACESTRWNKKEI